MTVVQGQVRNFAALSRQDPVIIVMIWLWCCFVHDEYAEVHSIVIAS